jgi:hypothetical protein
MPEPSPVRERLDREVASNRMALNLRDKKRQNSNDTDNKIDAARVVKRD